MDSLNQTVSVVERPSEPPKEFLRLYREVFGDGGLKGLSEKWADRMCKRHAEGEWPCRSWLIVSPAGFIVAHERGPSVVNVWHMGVVRESRGSGAFRRLVGALVYSVSPWTRLTMTTYPDRFEKMFSLLSYAATRCDSPEDAEGGKARFEVPVWTLLLLLNRRKVVALGSALVVVGVVGFFLWSKTKNQKLSKNSISLRRLAQTV
uniref:N-acetyltransferase domain-containing protein n=1 Tax=Chromera velia CCMP2878 TaxID=1169474 RepID=A0A0G4F9D2_9ALVE|mmetsp:Transcript_8450/g.16431  ORF Transcript_8450/g.16431 Transcript_8450/m.16431 type:complete len:205 (+) Transcript_8450:385-999(+)|eukprot:Cvel_15888.t1-p1 / transcript=Cvel_15888.t1 / gene=Cvel_15888 / organism=Chromera_velia_CCMP2878 / gene_product=hypothetical protein / transcript_product=hypothetical protein / location=Cvel_scaffold1199:46397-47008(+) / protein_length=204 / sequence_SO=supercontig / SO=protein_coding / is_pseudo=false